MLPGDIMGHETMGEVVDVGSGVDRKIKKGDRIVVPFTIICGECEQCKRGNFSVCETTNRKRHLADKAFGHTTAGLFGYTHLTGGYPGGQAEYLRVPLCRRHTHQGSSRHPRRAVAFSQRHFPDRLASRGALRHRADRHGRDLGVRAGGADGDPKRNPPGRQPSDRDRLPARAPQHGGGRRRHTIDFEAESVVERLNELTDGKGPEKCIDCAGMEAHVTASQPDTLLDRAKQMVMLENDRLTCFGR